MYFGQKVYRNVENGIMNIDVKEQNNIYIYGSKNFK